jgi:class 3 adenylate cyclase
MRDEPQGFERGVGPDDRDYSYEVASDEDLNRTLPNHAPLNWQTALGVETWREFVDGMRNDHYIFNVVIVDIRRSTILQKETDDPQIFGSIVGNFVEKMAYLVRKTGGWFDRYTGDGFIAYWTLPVGHNAWSLPPPGESAPTVRTMLATCYAMQRYFNHQTLEEFRRTSRNFPAGVGMALGIDAGGGGFALINDDMNLFGSTVVGATRMVETAGPNEAIANVALGRLLLEHQDLIGAEVEVTREHRGTKEYPKEMGGQEVYRLMFHWADLSDEDAT